MNRKINPGSLNKRIVIEKNVSAGEVNDSGDPIEKWESITSKPIWGSVTDVSGKEIFAHATDIIEDMVTVKIRYRQGITADMRLIFRGKPFDIQRVYSGDYSNDYLYIDCKATEGSGY